MQPIPAKPAINPPSASDYNALIELINQASRDLANGEIDSKTFRQRIVEIDERTHALDLLARVCRRSTAMAARAARQNRA